VVKIFIFCLLLCITVAFANPFLAGKGLTAATTAQSTNPVLIQYQQQLRSTMAQGILLLKKSLSVKGIIVLCIASFFYGLAHAAGPGHRKGVVFAYFLAKRSTPLEPLFIGLALALEHIITSLILVLGIKFFSGHLFKATGEASLVLENTAYAALALLGLFLLGLKARDIACCKTENHDKQKLATLFISGIIPCPAATLILIFCLIHNVLWLGIISVIAMSLGIAMLVALVGYLAAYGQKSLPSWLGKDDLQRQKIGDGLELAGLIMLVVFAMYMLLPAL